MKFPVLHRIAAFFVFAFSSVVFLMTVAPTLSFWDCGEFITAAVTMGVPHPPGAPMFQLIGRMFSFLPFGDLGFRVNLMSTFSSSFTVLFVYLVSMRLMRLWHGDPQTTGKALLMILSASIGALILSFSDTFWFNASEAEVYGIGMFFISVTVWIALEWYAHAGVFDSERSLLLIAYIMGLSIGVHLLSLLALFFVFFVIYFRDRDRVDMNVKSILAFVGLMGAGFFVVYPGIVKYLPKLLSSTGGLLFVIVLIAAMIAVVSAKKWNPHLRMGLLGALLVALGYSTYAIVPIRANDSPALNENAPTNLAILYSYLNREQYGDYPLLRGSTYDNSLQNINFATKKFLPRRWNPESVDAYKNYSSDFEYMMSFQFGKIYMRYFLWNFVGRAGDLQDAPVVFMGDAGDWSESPGYPNRYYAIPLLLGLIGMFYHFRKDWKTATSTTVLFLMTGVGLVIYFNMAEPQVRERDYFFVGSFYVFAIWAGLAAFGIWDMLRSKVSVPEVGGLLLAGALLVVGPGNMLKQNYQTHDRHHNYVAYDYAYNLLQSCDQDAILFTGGDNDTFPVWYLQYVAGIRRDVRVVNLSLVNTNWYALQLKNERPYGAKAVSLSFSDEQLNRMEPLAWETTTVEIPINPATISRAWMEDMPAAKGLALPTSFAWTVSPQWRDARGTNGLRNQDQMILDIVRNNINSRPIYFALSTAPSDRLGLDPHLVVEGLCARVTPFNFPTQSYRYYPAMNVPVTIKHLTNLAAEADSNRAFGFMFRELNNPDINLDEASSKMIYSFRLLYMELAKAVYQESGDKATADRVLQKMEEVMPEALHEMNGEIRTQLALTYFVTKNNEKAVAMTAEVEKFMMPDVEKFIMGDQSNRNAMSILLNLYYQTGQFDKGIALLRKYQQRNNDPSVEAEISTWQAQQTVRMPKDS